MVPGLQVERPTSGRDVGFAEIIHRDKCLQCEFRCDEVALIGLGMDSEWREGLDSVLLCGDCEVNLVLPEMDNGQRG